MAEIVNLRRARKHKARATKALQADANRTRHGIAKKVRDLAKARRDKDEQAIAALELDKEEQN